MRAALEGASERTAPVTYPILLSEIYLRSRFVARRHSSVFHSAAASVSSSIKTIFRPNPLSVSRFRVAGFGPCLFPARSLFSLFLFVSTCHMQRVTSNLLKIRGFEMNAGPTNTRTNTASLFDDGSQQPQVTHPSSVGKRV